MGAIRSYDRAEAEPVTIANRRLTDDRFLIWSCKNRLRQGWSSSIDYKASHVCAMLANPKCVADYIRLDMPVIGDTGYMKTHAHSMDMAYWPKGDPRPPLYVVGPMLDAVGEECSKAGVRFEFKTTRDVWGEMR